MNPIGLIIFLLLPQTVGVILLVRFYKEELKEGRPLDILRRGDGEGRWGSTLIMMGAVLFFVLGNENQWFHASELQGIITGVGGVLLIALISEGLAWILGKKKPENHPHKSG